MSHLLGSTPVQLQLPLVSTPTQLVGSASFPARCSGSHLTTAARAAQAFSLDSALLAISLRLSAGEGLLILRVSDRAHQLLTSGAPVSMYTQDVQLQWNEHKGQPRLAWLLPCWLGQTPIRLQEVSNLGCEVVILNWEASIHSRLQFARNGEAVCALSQTGLEVGRVSVGRCVTSQLASWSDKLCAFGPCCTLVLCVGWLTQAHRCVAALCCSDTGELLRIQHDGILRKCIGLAWSSNGVIALSSLQSVYLCTLLDRSHASLQLQHSFETTSPVCSLRFANCGWLLAFAQTARDGQHVVYLVQARSGAAVVAAMLPKCSDRGCRGVELMWEQDSSSLIVCGPARPSTYAGAAPQGCLVKGQLVQRLHLLADPQASVWTAFRDWVPLLSHSARWCSLV